MTGIQLGGIKVGPVIGAATDPNFVPAGAPIGQIGSDPGDPDEATVYEGYGGVRARGVNSKGEKCSNYYEFAPAGDRLVLIGITADKQ